MGFSVVHASSDRKMLLRSLTLVPQWTRQSGAKLFGRGSRYRASDSPQGHGRVPSPRTITELATTKSSLPKEKVSKINRINVIWQNSDHIHIMGRNNLHYGPWLYEWP